jgi:hypothetical protein
MHPTLIIQELQTIKCIKQHTSLQLNSISLLSYIRDDCHKQVILISESHGDSKRCTPCREKPDQYVTCFPRSVRIWSQTICMSHGQRIVIFYEIINRFIQIHDPREEGIPTQSTARRPSDLRFHTQLLSHNSQ